MQRSPGTAGPLLEPWASTPGVDAAYSDLPGGRADLATQPTMVGVSLRF